MADGALLLHRLQGSDSDGRLSGGSGLCGSRIEAVSPILTGTVVPVVPVIGAGAPVIAEAGTGEAVVILGAAAGSIVPVVVPEGAFVPGTVVPEIPVAVLGRAGVVVLEVATSGSFRRFGSGLLLGLRFGGFGSGLLLGLRFGGFGSGLLLDLHFGGFGSGLLLGLRFGGLGSGFLLGLRFGGLGSGFLLGFRFGCLGSRFLFGVGLGFFGENGGFFLVGKILVEIGDLLALSVVFKDHVQLFFGKGGSVLSGLTAEIAVQQVDDLLFRDV